MPISTPPLNPHPFPSNLGRKRIYVYCMVCGSSFSQCDGQRAADTGARPHIAVDTGDGACRRPPLGVRTRLVIITTYQQHFVNVVVQLHVFVQLQQDVEVKYPELLTTVVSRVMASMTQVAGDNDGRRRLFTNLIHLCQWNNTPDSQLSARYNCSPPLHH